MTPQELIRIYPFASSKVSVYAPLLTVAMAQFEIDTPRRQAAFLAQVGHESGQLKYTEELADGHAYDGRVDLGNTSPGDGPRYKGRGLLQITGRSNYERCGRGLGIDLLSQPDVLALPENAVRSAAWFWKEHDLNQFADSDRFGSLTKQINGGYNGLDQRIQLWITARRVLAA
jgi:putative chitinase